MEQSPVHPITACLVLADGTVFHGIGFGATGQVASELCFNTAMTGYQEIMTDPSYAGQIINFTFPHIGNIGTTDEDQEDVAPEAAGMVVRSLPTAPSNWRAQNDLDTWLKQNGRIGIAGVDTRRLTRAIRRIGAPNAVLCHDPDGAFDLQAMVNQVQSLPRLEGQDLAKEVTRTGNLDWRGGLWSWPEGYETSEASKYHVVAVDFGAKDNILRCLDAVGARVTVVPASATAQDILKLNPDGVFLSNGPGDPAATGAYAVPMIQELLKVDDLPIFGICLGHQLLGLAVGAQTVKMNHGHHGANHPVKDLDTGKVEITSMNHGFSVNAETLPQGVVESHRSLFDGTNCGLRIEGRPVFSVQYHPEASPGPQDSFYLFERFSKAIEARQSVQVTQN